MSVRPELATVYRCSDGRRYFTARGALRHEAHVKISGDKCYCGKDIRGDVEEPCHYHCIAEAHPTQIEASRIADRYARRYRRALELRAKGRCPGCGVPL